MNKFFTAYRYFVFVLFIICNIVLCSVAAWNLTIALAIQFETSIQVDAVLIAVGAAGLLFIFPILLIDVLRKESVTRQVWFECLWAGLFALLELAGAAAVTTTMSGMECVASDDDGQIKLGPCISTKLSLIFAWIAAANLFFYMCILAVVAMLHQHNDALVWKSNVLGYDWFAVRSSLGSAPPSPSRPGPSTSRLSRAFARLPRRTEFSKRMVVGREPQSDLEKQDMRDRAEGPFPPTPRSLAMGLKSGMRPSLDGPRPSLDRARPSLDRQRPSLDRSRPSLDRPRPSFDQTQAAAAFTPRKFQLSAVPASSGIQPQSPVAARPSLERPTPSFTPRKLQLSTAVPATATVPRTMQADDALVTPAVPQTAGPQKKRVLRLHRPPSLDLSRIGNFV